jgi:hypothetical protein
MLGSALTNQTAGINECPDDFAIGVPLSAITLSLQTRPKSPKAVYNRNDSRAKIHPRG